MALVSVDALTLRLPAVPHLTIANADASILGDAFGKTLSTTFGLGLGILVDQLLDELPLVVKRGLVESIMHLLLEPCAERADLAEELLEADFPGVRVVPVEIQSRLDAGRSNDGDAGVASDLGERLSESLSSGANDVHRGTTDEIESVFDATSPPEWACVERGAQVRRAEAAGLTCELNRALEQIDVESVLDDALTEVEERALREERLIRAEAVKDHLPAHIHHGQLDGLVVGNVQGCLQQRGERELGGRHAIFAALHGRIHRHELRLHRLIEQPMTKLSKEHEDAALLASLRDECLLLAQLDGWIPSTHGGPPPSL